MSDICLPQGMMGGYVPGLPQMQGPVDGIVSMGSLQSHHHHHHHGLTPPPHLLQACVTALPNVPIQGVMAQGVAPMVGSPAPGISPYGQQVSGSYCSQQGPHRHNLRVKLFMSQKSLKIEIICKVQRSMLGF
ncbi:hypothetical protein XELAEV_18004702mg [Xenopus laevis]|uniref:Uncharacterized protein n=1 Tax=Xenopus laevis TaxID=8355 RepID=A0A974BR01_XENLA|nr:hypothetical protein XELAEV_18004702mg [Xenopus laevis]